MYERENTTEQTTAGNDAGNEQRTEGNEAGSEERTEENEEKTAKTEKNEEIENAGVICADNVDSLGVEWNADNFYKDKRKTADGRWRVKIGKSYPWPEGKEPAKKEKKTKEPAFSGGRPESFIVIPGTEPDKEKKLTKAELLAALKEASKNAAEDYQLTIETLGQTFTSEENGQMSKNEKDSLIATGYRAAMRNGGSLPAMPPWACLGAQTAKYGKRVATSEDGKVELENISAAFGALVDGFKALFRLFFPEGQNDD